MRQKEVSTTFHPEVLPAIRQKDKLASTLRTIGDAAAELDVEPHVLRFWEKQFRQVAPVRRRGGRRHYRPEDMELLRRIRDLLYRQGYTIKGAQQLLADGCGVPAPHRQIEARPDPYSLDGANLRPLAASDDDRSRPDIAGVLQDLRDALAALREALVVS